jgi:hypothetical protein
MKRLLREPLVHFAAIGALLFVVFARWGSEEAPTAEAADQILLTGSQVRHLAATFERVWQRPPTADELQGLIDDHIREEVYVREALQLGLDEDDTVIRRRLRQKVEFLHEDRFDPPEPSEAELERFLRENPQWFARDAVYSFRHVYFSSDRGDQTLTDAQMALAQLLSNDDAPPAGELGDSFLLGFEFTANNATQVGRLFGETFLKQLRTLPPGPWQGPIESGYGLHLVKLESMSEGRLPALAEVRDAVLEEWTHHQRVKANEAFYQSLKQRYTVTIEPNATADAAGPE